MRKAKFTTVWKLPSTLRKERFVELFSKKEFREILNSDFIKGVESRRDLLQARRFKLYAWQVPLFLFLALSLVPVKISGAIFGVSIDSAKTLREVLLVISSTLGLAALFIQSQGTYLEEILDAVAIKQSANNKDLKEFLTVRYGTGTFLLRDYNDDLKSNAKLVAGVIFLVILVLLLLLLFSATTAIHIFNLVEVYLHPNFSNTISVLVMAYVILADIVLVLGFFLIISPLPYSTWEDLRKLERLRSKDPAAYDAVISAMVRKHLQKGFLRRIFGRPTLPRLP